MYQSDSARKNHRMMREIFVRAFLLCVLSCTGLFSVASSLAIAAPAHNTTSNVVRHLQPASASQPSSPAKAQHIHRNPQGLLHAAAPLGPDLALSLIANASSYTVGQVVTYTLSVTNNATAAPILAGAPITVTDVLPLGLTGIAALALPGQWNLSLSASTSPAILTATYTGATPVTPGGVLPPVTLFGVLAPTAQGTFSDTASVSVAGDLNLTDNIATLSVSVSAVSTSTPTPTVAPTATPTPTPTVVPTATPTATPTIAPTATPTVVPTATPTVVPTATPTVAPTVVPTATPTVTPTVVPTATPTVAPTATPTVVPTATPPIIFPPDLSITQSFANSTSIQVGQPVSLTLTVSNGNSAGTILQGASIQVNDILPLGFNQISASGNDWFIFTTSPTGPSLLSAIYTGPILISPGEVLPPITITGTLDANILPSLINTASVSTTGDANPAGNVSTAIITVIPAPTPTVVVAPDLNIVQSILGPGANNRVVSGQPLSITLASNNVASAGPLARASTVTIYDVLPTGLSQIVATGNNWFILITSTTGPALLTAIYSSPASLPAGQALPLLTIRGIVNANVGDTTLTNTAVISAAGDVNTTNNTVTTTVHVYLPITPTVPAPVISPGASAFILPRVRRV